MPETSLRTDVSDQDNGRPAEPSRETNGITSRIVLLYVERVGGASAVDAVLERAGLEGRKERLLDENYWFSYKEKIALFEAVAEVLDDPEAMLHIGGVVLELNVGEALRLALRALGSPRLVYQNIVRANAKFTGSHRMDLLELGRDYARIRYRDLTVRRRYHPLDCQYNRGLLVCIPELFGQPPARISHPVCGCRGGDSCVYELRWDERSNDARVAVGAGAVSAAAAGGAALFAPALLPAAAGVAVVAGALIGWRAVQRDRARWRQVEQELGEQSRLAERLTSSLQDLVSELRIEDVLAKVTRNAQSAVGGKEFALLIDDDSGLGCQSCTGLPRSVKARLEQWAEHVGEQLQEPLTVEDVSLVPELSALPRDGSPSFGSLCAAPMIFRGERLGVLVALATQPRTFLPRDLDLIQSYATQAAIALTNARLYQSKEQLASRDPLTGLLNHREFHEALGRELTRGDRYGGEFSVALFDIDRFKAVNDVHGHAQGDRVLRDVADALAGACRASDLAFRIGGDEFALILPNTDAEAAEVAAARGRAAVASLRGTLDASFGIAVWPADAGNKDSLLERADARLYEMKRAPAGKPLPDG